MLMIGMNTTGSRPACWFAAVVGTILLTNPASAYQIDIVGPSESGMFGTTVTVLPNGNIVITDPYAGSSNEGAVYLYSPTGNLINGPAGLTGGTAGDYVGESGIVVLANGNFVVRSPDWHNDGIAYAGAATWVNGTTGLAGNVSASNSLVGTTPGDSVGADLTALTNGNYVVGSPLWSNGANGHVGAATWADGSKGLSGPVTAENSLYGTGTGDGIGGRIVALANGNYVVASPYWNVRLGAVTWGNGNAGIAGPVSINNSLVGGQYGDEVGTGVTALRNGNYVVASPFWGNAARVGACTWANGAAGLVGTVSAGNSLIGEMNGDFICTSVVELSNGNYVVGSHLWHNGAGAATWVNGTTGLVGVVSSDNSLVGTAMGDEVAGYGIVPLSNGNYVVQSPTWTNGVASNAGAVTWGNGKSGTVGALGPSNSLLGMQQDDLVGYYVTALTNGNYVVASPYWTNGDVPAAGAVTFANGISGLIGAVAADNSLVGATAGDKLGIGRVTALRDGDYVIASPVWNDGATIAAGAATRANGVTGLVGVVTSANSLIGKSPGADVGLGGVTPLANGSFVVASQIWKNDNSAGVGAVTWANASDYLVGSVSATNSLVGANPGDGVGDVTALADGNYVIASHEWDNGTSTNAGAITLADGSSGLIGTIDASNSVRGSTAYGGDPMTFAYDAARMQLAVGRPHDNIVSLLVERIFASGFEP